MQDNFSIGIVFKRIIYFMGFLILILIGVVIYLSYTIATTTCERDIMEQDGIYNLIDSEGNMITTDGEVLEKFIEEYYNGKAKKN